MTTKLSVVLCTVPDVDTGKKIARALVEERFCACVNVVPAVTSVYRWQGKLEEATEALLVMKTSAERVAPLVARAKELHPYDTPELIALPVEAALPAYAEWIAAETARVVL